MRLAESLFFGSVDDAGDSVFDEDDVEVNKQAKALAGQSQMGEKLLFANRRQHLDQTDHSAPLRFG